MPNDDETRSFSIDWRQVCGADREIRQGDIYYAMRNICVFRHLDRIDVARVTVHDVTLRELVAAEAAAKAAAEAIPPGLIL